MSVTLSLILLCTQVSRVCSVDGVLFFLAYMNPSTNLPNSGIQEIHISGSMNVDTKVRVQVLPLNYTYMYQLNSTNSWQKTLSVYQDLAGPPGTKLPASVIISSQAPISVQTCKSEDGTSGGYLALPITEVSLEYMVASYTARGPGASFSVAAPYYTCVTVYKENGTQTVREMDFSLDPGQVYHVNAPSDLTGRHVKSKNPVAVYSGLDCAYVNQYTPSVQKCDHIVEQLAPLATYGMNHAMSSFYGRSWSTGYQIRVVAAYDDTIVRWAEFDLNPTTGAAGAPVVKGPQTINTGNFMEITVSRPSNTPVAVLLTCSNPCEVMQYGESFDMTPAGTDNGVKPDSVMVTVPSFDSYTNDVTFSTSKLYNAAGNQTLENVNGLTVIVKSSDLSKLKLDGQPLQTALQNAKTATLNFPTALSGPSETYSVVFGGPLSPGFHRVTADGNSPDVKYTVFVYGWAPVSGSSDSSGYAYLAGWKNNDADFPPIKEGPWFDFSAPAGEAPVMNTPSPITPGGPGQPITPTEFPSYESIWEIPFYILHPQRADLKTRNCSEAYELYYMLERFEPMRQRVITMTYQQCQPGVTSNMTHLLYYSEYTDGMIKFKLSVTGSGAVSLNDMFDCMQRISDYIQLLPNWVPVGYKDETSFLRPDASYNKHCDEIHMGKTNFESYYYGWNCPYYGGRIGASHASNVKVQVGLLALLATITSLLLQRR